MDGEKNGKPYFLMDALGGKPHFSDESKIGVLFPGRRKG